MSSLEIIGLVAIILISTFAVVGIIIAIPIFRLLNRTRLMVEKLDRSLIPMVDKLNNTVTHLNSEIISINEITQNASSIVGNVEKIMGLATIIITSPIIKLIRTGIGFTNGIKKALGKNNKNNL
ncbi:MAG: hypothetical protein ACYCXB_06700 [Candidatus Humimicrobiaceae bacterium]